AAAMLRGRDPQKELDRQLEETNLDFPQPETQPILRPSREDFVAMVQTQGETRDVGGTEGAVDVLVREIEAKVRERKTLVVWLFDASQSLNARRKEIADRFGLVYKQLRERNKGIDARLTTAVVSFGASTTFLTPEPVSDVTDVVNAVRRIKPDTKGKEYVFTAINDVMRMWKRELLSYRGSSRTRRNVMLVVVTDERGDDYAGKSGRDYGFLDLTIRDMRGLNIYGYCVGNAAVFGREKGYVSFTDDTGYKWNSIAVDQGPETVAPERLNIPFWGGRSRSVERLSANYGPYALTRMCAETGGLYLITHHSAGAMKFPANVMRKYKPFYGTIPRYLRDVNSNLAKRAVFEVAGDSLREPIPSPKLSFRADSETVLRNQLKEAQKPFARLDYHLRAMIAKMEQGEKQRPRVKEYRWQAAFDLAMGRLLATRVRAFGYQSTLSGMSASPLSFKKPGSNQWRLVPSAKWQSYPPPVKKLAKKATFYLKRVIDEHPNTPWALLAEHELSTEMGWAWREGRMVIPRRTGNGNNDPGVLLADDDPNNPRKRKKKPQARRKPPQL
ncbi:MAG: vWA domain-containing protein, partial [Planctomycetaceae bacterium]